MKTERFKTAIDTIYTWYTEAVSASTIHPKDAVDELRLELEGLLTASMYLLSRSSYSCYRRYGNTNTVNITMVVLSDLTGEKGVYMNDNLKKIYIEGIIDLMDQMQNINIIGGLYICAVEAWKKDRKLLVNRLED